VQLQKTPLLILAQSGRFLAQSAAQAHHPVWVADCFGDQDTLAVSQRWQQLPDIDSLSIETILDLINTLSQGENCFLVCGSGIEGYYPFLSQLPDNIKLIGNSADTILKLKTPELFFNLLAELDINYPASQFKPPLTQQGWLSKSASGMGGGHIQKYLQQSTDKATYYQRYIEGKSGSILFLANGENTLTLSINQQFTTPDSRHPFRLAGIDSPWILSQQHQMLLKKIIHKISQNVGLLGLNSVDFILSDLGELLILEVNPRPSASAELLQTVNPLIQHHIEACQGHLPDELMIMSHRSLRYHYADKALMISNIIWGNHCYDRPQAGTTIHKDEPIFTSIVPIGQTTLHDVIAANIMQQLLD